MLEALPLSGCQDVDHRFESATIHIRSWNIDDELHRARELLLQDRVTLDYATDLEAFGTAYETPFGRHEYRIHVRFEQERFHVRCRCAPTSRMMCSHSLALILLIADRHADAAGRPRPSHIEPAAEERIRWRGALQRVDGRLRGATGTTASRRRFVALQYVIQPYTWRPDEFVAVSIRAARRGRTDELGRGESLLSALRRTTLAPQDRALLLRLFDSTLHASTIRKYRKGHVPDDILLGPDDVEELLPQIVATGNAFHRLGTNVPRPLTRDAGGAWAPRFSDFTDAGRRWLGVQIRRGDERLSIDDLRLYEGTRWIIAGDQLIEVEYRDEIERAWTEELVKRGAVRLPAEHGREFVARALGSGGLPRGLFAEFDLRHGVEPRPVLTLHRPTPRSHHRGRLHWEYAGLSTRIDSEHGLRVADSRAWIVRDRRKEEEHRRRLLAAPGVVEMPHDGDCDVRIPPGRVQAATEYLLERGFSVELDGRRLPDAPTCGGVAGAGAD